ncbi:hypothetical protein FA13DRAFT_1145589 [Coprinellus micaceus]|uniref:Uncharacterized protein n=1 Tax=Coprinellus micaceus TaxID=71717 RepID=A0A4Y7RJ83_COPMI|nr:hypothetical protein FA13DRAFT_1145589 [Coprinellus micaceus]
MDETNAISHRLFSDPTVIPFLSLRLRPHPIVSPLSPFVTKAFKPSNCLPCSLSLPAAANNSAARTSISTATSFLDSIISSMSPRVNFWRQGLGERNDGEGIRRVRDRGWTGSLRVVVRLTRRSHGFGWYEAQRHPSRPQGAWSFFQLHPLGTVHVSSPEGYE